MTYSQRLRQCSGYCRGSCLSLDLGSLARQLQPLESALNCLGRRMDIPLRYDDTAVSGNPHDGESIYSPFPSLVSIVWRRECGAKSAGKIGRRLPSTSIVNATEHEHSVMV